MLDLTLINQATSVWWQGDYVLVEALPELLQFGMLALQVKEELEAPTEEKLTWDPINVQGFVLISQTCDVTRIWNGKDDRKWVLVAPLVKLSDSQWKAVIKGKLPRFHVTEALREIGLSMDLERIQTLSKAALAQLTPFRLGGCKTQEERRELSQVLAEKYYRPAFPDDFTSSESGHEGAIADLERYLGQVLRQDGDLRDFLLATDEIRVMPFGENLLFPWDSPEVQVLFYFVVRAKTVTPEDLARWEACAEDIVARMKTSGRFRLHGTGYTVRNWNTLSAAEYRHSDWLPY